MRARGADDYIRVEDDCTSVRNQDNDLITQREEASYVARAIEALCHGEGLDDALCGDTKLPDELGKPLQRRAWRSRGPPTAGALRGADHAGRAAQASAAADDPERPALAL